jgi:hypothetical protein
MKIAGIRTSQFGVVFNYVRQGNEPKRTQSVFVFNFAGTSLLAPGTAWNWSKWGFKNIKKSPAGGRGFKVSGFSMFYLVVNLYIVVVEYFSPGFRVVDGKSGLLGESGKCWVSRHNPFLCS